MATTNQSLCIPQIGQIVRIRTRTYLVEDVEPLLGSHRIRAACLDDDAQGQILEAVWELELDTAILGEDTWKSIGDRGFDPPRLFGSYVHALKWNCVTATNPRLFQAPFRAGIRIDAYQLEPLRKALLLPRVNLFIADDVGLGKTIEAGLIANELLLRRRIKEIVVACPPSMVPQWKDELESRFGLTFEILDRAYIERVRQQHGYAVNPWTTFPRFLISQRLLIDETYVAPMRDWLDTLRPGSLLILDEAHHAAPSSGAKYAIDSRITRAIRDLAPRFEHRLFLSATPHNGHSNSFSALLEILDSQRFCRGVKVLKSHLDHVMVRRLKEDVRELEGGFPKRHVRQIDIDNLPEGAPELILSRLLEEYRQVRSRRMEGATKRKQAEAALLISGLQQRLLSSVEAFARTLRVHRRTMERIWEREATEQKSLNRQTKAKGLNKNQLSIQPGSVDRDSDLSNLTEDELAVLEESQYESSTESTAGDGALAERVVEKRLLDEMTDVAESSRGLPDARLRFLIDWVQRNMCNGVHLPGQGSALVGAAWNDLRLLIFTEYEDTKRYLVNMLRAAVADTELADHRIEVFHGPTPPEKREQIKRAFNAKPEDHPIRILVATDSAREGLNLQAHCHNLFHFDVPWNPARIEQRNGRIDRKLQPSPEVFCHYFVYKQRPEDRVLQALVRKTKTIREELGSLAEVLESRLAKTLESGITHDRIDEIARGIDQEDIDADQKEATEEELEATRDRHDKLKDQITLLERRVEEARKWIGLDMESLRDTISCSLEMLGSEALKELPALDGEPPRFEFPNLETRQGGDPTWMTTLDTLRAPPKDGKAGFRWRKEEPVRPVVFQSPEGIDDSVVQLHLHHRIVQRLLSRFLSQGFVYHDLSRACMAQTKDNIPRVVLLGRLSMYGSGASRLHEEMITVTARWSAASKRREPLSPYARDAEAKTIELLEEALSPNGQKAVPKGVQEQLKQSISLDIEQLIPHLKTRGEEARADAEKALIERGRAEAGNMQRLLEDQRKRVLTELGKSIDQQLSFFTNQDEKRQYESNRRYWQRWVENVEADLEKEPARILDFYKINSTRIEPVGIVYLYPLGE